MSWLVKPKKHSEKHLDYVLHGVKCLVKVQDGYVYVEATAKTHEDVKVLRHMISRFLASVCKGLEEYEGK